STTVLLIDNHEVVRSGLRRVLESRDSVRVVADAPYRSDVVAIAAAEHPDVIVVDPDTGDGVSLDLIANLMDVASQARILVLTSVRDPYVCAQSVMLGAHGMVDKCETEEVLFKAITKLQSGEVWLDRSRTAAVLSQVVRRRRDEDLVDLKIQSLTAREQEIIGLICDGLRNKEAADRLFISEATVRNHVTSILDKLDLANRFDLVVFAHRHRLIERTSSSSNGAHRARTSRTATSCR